MIVSPRSLAILPGVSVDWPAADGPRPRRQRRTHYLHGTKTADTADGACSVTDCSLREAVIAANANSGTDTINLPGGTIIFQIAGASENAAASGDLDITDDVTINGNNTIVNGGDLDRIFHILPGAGVTISNTTIFDGTNASGYPGGGGIGLEGSLTIVTALSPPTRKPVRWWHRHGDKRAAQHGRRRGERQHCN